MPILCSNRAQVMNAGKSSGSNQTVSYRMAFYSTQAGRVTAPRLVFAHHYLDTTGEADGETTPVLVKAGIEVGSVTSRVFFRGARVGTIEPGGILISDPVGIVIPANTQFWVRTRASVNTLGDKWPTTIAANFANLGEGYSSSPNDQADATGALTNNALSNLYAPCAILGDLVGATNQNTVAIIGSSSAYGQGDTAEAPTWDLGYLSRIVGNEVGSIKLTRGSQTVAQWVSDNNRRLAVLDAVRPTHAIFQLGTNDITAGTAVATIKANLLSAWTDLTNRGIKVWGTTFTPVTTSSDSWATVANQTLNAWNANRIAVNDWLRTIPSPLVGVYEIADMVETTRNSGLWKITGSANGFTADGQHLSPFGHRTVAAGFPQAMGIV